MFRTLADGWTEPRSRSRLPLWARGGEISTGKGRNTDIVPKEVAGTLSPFVCREEPFRRRPFPLKAGGWRVGPVGEGVPVETNQAVSSHSVTALSRAEDERMGTQGAEQRTGARSKEMPRNGI